MRLSLIWEQLLNDTFEPVYPVPSIKADLPDDAHLLLKGIAMLERPANGAYRFMEKKINFSDHRNLLPYKKKIGYITSDASMISNMSIRENLLLMRYYFENSLSLDIKDNVKNLCVLSLQLTASLIPEYGLLPHIHLLFL